MYIRINIYIYIYIYIRFHSVLSNDTAKSSDCIMLNVWLISDEIKRERIYGCLNSLI